MLFCVDLLIRCFKIYYNFFLQLQPMTTGDIDPAVLASLPPSMQLDLLVQVKMKTYRWFLCLPLPPIVYGYNLQSNEEDSFPFYFFFR